MFLIFLKPKLVLIFEALIFFLIIKILKTTFILCWSLGLDHIGFFPRYLK